MPSAKHVSCLICEETRSDSSFSFHRFPKDEATRNKWIEWCTAKGYMKKNDNIENNVYICATHFAPGSFKNKMLKRRAVPCLIQGIPVEAVETSNNQGKLSNASQSCVGIVDIHVETSNNQPQPCSLRQTSVGVGISEIHMETSNNEVQPCSSRQISVGSSRKRKLRYIKDFRSEDMEDVRAAKKFRRVALKQIQIRTQENLVLKKRNRRLARKVTNLETLLKFLKRKDLVSSQAAQQILEGVPSAVRQLIERRLKFPNKKKDRKYQPELRTFALTLQFYSSRAYNYVRKMWGNLLPHPSTIKNWYSAIDGKAGFTLESLKAISLKMKNSQGPLFCNIVIDEMKIKDQIIWDNNRFYGTVDMGTGLVARHDNGTKASYALVFMAVGLNQSWKIPLGYFFIRSLDAEERANLLTRCLELMHETGVTVHSITFDGAASNISMAHHLGANLKDPLSTNFKPWFLNPLTSEKIFVFLDPSHMIKLVRNTLGDLMVLRDYEGNIIKWQLIEDLVEIQKKQGLQLANKLSQKHVDYTNNKMSVKLAAQVLSQSTSNALLFLKHHQNMFPQFSDAEPTAKFCLMLNNAFDLLNCHSKFSKKNQYSLPINFETKSGLKRNAFEIINYLAKLKDNIGTPLLKHPRKTGFLGLTVALTNVFDLFDELQPKGLEYLISFKISQDFLETFFSAVRSRGGVEH